jgi:hypothetical protein
LELISIFQLIDLLSWPDTLQNATWVNYTNTPCKNNSSYKGGKQFMMPPTMMNLFGSIYLTEEDWKIPES